MKREGLLFLKHLTNTIFLLLQMKGYPFTTYLVAFGILLTSCAPAPFPVSPTVTPLLATPTLTDIQAAPTLMPTILPSPTDIKNPTATPILCDAYLEFCLDDGHFLLARPIDATYLNQIERGYRYGTTVDGKRDPHHGVEFSNASGTPVLAAAAGTVIFAADDKPAIFSPWSRFYGNLVVIQHDLPEITEPIYTLYAHLSTIQVEEGEVVQAAQQVGEVGMSGGAIGSHLHFEVRVGGKTYTDTRNPELWLKQLSGNHGAIVMRVANQDGKLIRIPLLVDKVEDAESTFERVARLEAYAPENYPVGVDDIWEETHAIADLPVGKYRLSFSYAGKNWERFVEVRPTKVTAVYFMID